MVQSSQTILLAEDDPGDVLLTQRAFRKAQIINPIQIVSDGQQTIAYLSGEGKYADRETYPLPVLLLLDLKMPKRSGLEVLDWLRAQPDLKRMMVVVLTSSREAPDVNRAFELGVTSYLVKPVEFDALLEMVRGLHLYLLLLSEKPSISPVGTEA